jgi:hypothetical protein
MFSAHLDFSASAASLALPSSTAPKSSNLYRSVSSDHDKDIAMDRQISRPRTATGTHTISSVTQDYQMQISPATGKELHPRENSGLKYLIMEQQAKFWETVMHWKDRFSEAKWQEALRRIERAKKEAILHVLGWQMLPRIHHSFGTPGGRQLLLCSFSSLTVPTGAHPLRPPECPRLESASPTTPRPRWDVVSSGPVTPLSATDPAAKKGNAFAEGGFWAKLSPKTPMTAVPIPATPITAMPIEPWVPDTPTDPEAKAVYDEVHEEVHHMALKLCASRLALHSTNEYDLMHPSMVRPKDSLLAAEFTLDSLQVDLSKHIQPDLPEKIERFADEEAAALRSYSVRTKEELVDLDHWLYVEDKTRDLTTILEAQRDVLRMNRDRRKNESLRLSDQAVRLAWATKIVEDKEYLVESEVDGSSDGSDEDEGYDYNNFVRSIRSISSQDSLSYDEPALSSRSSMNRTISSTSPTTISTPEALRLRSRQGTRDSQATSMRRSNATAHRKNLSITTSIPASSISTLQMSPEERGLRRMGPSTGDLASWAEELRKMEYKRTEMQLERTSKPSNGRRHGSQSKSRDIGHGSVDGIVHPAFRSQEGVSLLEEYAGGLPPPPKPKPGSGYNRQAATSYERRVSGLPTRPCRPPGS